MQIKHFSKASMGKYFGTKQPHKGSVKYIEYKAYEILKKELQNKQ